MGKILAAICILALLGAVAAAYFYVPPVSESHKQVYDRQSGVQVDQISYPAVEVASATECSTLFEMLQNQFPKAVAKGLPVFGQEGAVIHCQWQVSRPTALAMNGNDLTAATGRLVKTNGSGRMVPPHMEISGPRYSLLHTWAKVDIGISSGPEDGVGRTCSLAWLGIGWKLVGCRSTWIS